MPQAPQSSHNRRAESEIQPAIPLMQSVCGMENSMEKKEQNSNGTKITYSNGYIYSNGKKRSAKIYKASYILLYIAFAVCFLVGIPTFTKGGFAFVIVGIILYLPACVYYKVYREYKEYIKGNSSSKSKN